MQENPLVNLVTAGSEPFVSAVPTLVDTAPKGFDIRFHLAGRNPQASQLQAHPDCLLVFTGPSCYVSPSWYGEQPNVPTWNYVAVHVYGRAVPMLPAELESLLRELSRRFETSVGESWQYDDLPNELRQQLLAEIRGFRIEPSRVEAKSKLSQNRGPQDRARVMRKLLQSADPSANAVGRWMSAKFPELARDTE